MKKHLVHGAFFALCLGQLVTLTGCGKCNSCHTQPQTVTSAEPATKKRKLDTGSAGIQTLPSGLRYQIIQDGSVNARAAQRGNKVAVHYTGWLNTGNNQKGKMFDSSVTRGKRFEFLLGAGQVIRGWDEGVQNMKIGEKRMLYVPARLGYGSQAMGTQIPANSDLIFEVELFEIK